MNPTHLNFDKPAFIEGIQFYADLNTKHRVAPSASESQSMSQTDLFTSGHAAMALGGHWRYQTLERAGDLDFDLAVLPTGPKGHAAQSNIGTTGLAIAASSLRKQQAWEFVKFATGPVGTGGDRRDRPFRPGTEVSGPLHWFCQGAHQDQQYRGADRRPGPRRGSTDHPGLAEDRRIDGSKRWPSSPWRASRHGADSRFDI